MTHVGPPLQKGYICQISPDFEVRPFAGCFLVVTDPRPWGAIGYVQSLGQDNEPGGQAYVRVKLEDLVLVGAAEWIVE